MSTASSTPAIDSEKLVVFFETPGVGRKKVTGE